jgi:hypothetical protein
MWQLLDFDTKILLLYNSSGICVLINDKPTEKLNISGLADGIYFTRIYINGMSQTKKIVIEKSF